MPDGNATKGGAVHKPIPSVRGCSNSHISPLMGIGIGSGSQSQDLGCMTISIPLPNRPCDSPGC